MVQHQSRLFEDVGSLESARSILRLLHKVHIVVQQDFAQRQPELWINCAKVDIGKGIRSASYMGLPIPDEKRGELKAFGDLVTSKF